ncbi:coiled-coil-helix-coiled-coil-helix domain-containing protein 7-like [Saccostrea echinata]|uniref:coiled-coil-helix-coiled-coil-helix domain-containing protein 7-like n=1 Tax=Saccostrea echinata TaxID=191078 RepID=UPI002A7F8485|nr:coiled-coil-helix-coiled-coil-helix domain-containing protein 7-like [Saccostrea echinata]
MDKFRTNEAFVKDGKEWEDLSKASTKKRAEEFKQLEATRNDTDPCYKEGQMALDCLKKHMYDKSKCVLEFENTRACKKFWNKVQWHRFFARIKPSMPEKEEWENVKKEYSKWLSK